MSLREIHGIGFKSFKKLSKLDLSRVSDVWKAPDALALLKETFGTRQGQILYDYCQGIDVRKVEVKPRQSIGAQCSTRVRFDGLSYDWPA